MVREGALRSLVEAAGTSFASALATLQRLKTIALDAEAKAGNKRLRADEFGNSSPAPGTEGEEPPPAESEADRQRREAANPDVPERTEEAPLDKDGLPPGWEAEDTTAGLGAASSTGLAPPLPGASAVANWGDTKQEQERAATAAMELRLDQLRHKDVVDKKRKEAAARKGAGTPKGGAGTSGATAVKSAPAQPKVGAVAETTPVTQPGVEQQSG